MVRIFLMVVAVLIVMGNLYVLTTSEDPTDLSRHDWSELPGLLVATLPGLLIAEVLLGLARPALEVGFLLRYAMLVLTVCLGGALYGALIPFLVALFGESLPVTDRITGGLVVGFIGAVIGGALGLAEGLVLAVPLAAVLGLFRNGR